MSNFTPRCFFNRTGTGPYNPRIWVEKSFNRGAFGFSMLPGLKMDLDNLSCWGGHDKSGAGFLSWEIPVNRVRIVEKMIRDGYMIETRDVEWLKFAIFESL